MEYASETDTAEAAKRYQDVELDGHKLYVIKAMTERMMSFGEMAFTVIYYAVTTQQSNLFWAVCSFVCLPRQTLLLCCVSLA